MAKAEEQYVKLREMVIDQAREREGKVDRKLMEEKRKAFRALREEQRAEARASKRSLQEEYIRSIPDKAAQEDTDERLNRPADYAKRRASEKKRK